MNSISRNNQFKGLSKLDRDLETLESLWDLSKLYEREVQNKLNNITLNPVLQAQIKDALGF